MGFIRDPMKKLLFLTITFVTMISARPGSEPFISGDTFRKYANFIMDRKYDFIKNQDTRFNPKDVKKGDIIFVDLSCMEEFFTKFHPKIRSKYILITHNHDYSAPGKYFNYLKDKNLYVWFTQNADIACHPKLIPIPIGLSNKHWNQSKGNDTQLKLMQEKFKFNEFKKYLLYGNFNVNTNPRLRKPIQVYFKKFPFCLWNLGRPKPYEEYLEDLVYSKFVLSPHGNGLDCIRTWEALYMGSYPVVKTSSLDQLYQDLPVLIVNKWEDVTQEFLEKKYFEMKSKKYNLNKLYFDYWLDLIILYQKNLLS